MRDGIKIWFIGFILLVVLVSGCTYFEPIEDDGLVYINIIEYEDDDMVIYETVETHYERNLKKLEGWYKGNRTIKVPFIGYKCTGFEELPDRSGVRCYFTYNDTIVRVYEEYKCYEEKCYEIKDLEEEYCLMEESVCQRDLEEYEVYIEVEEDGYAEIYNKMDKDLYVVVNQYWIRRSWW